MGNVKVSEKQNLLDVAIQRGGSVEAAFELAIINGISVTDELQPGQTIKLGKEHNADVARYFRSKGIAIETADTTLSDEYDRLFDESLPEEFE